ncbi:hypothetical protein A176_001893 [Myxococcus hansupus]|uniref:Glycosyltransferase n=1 Tax=Pseudomyxococcus hansupus TaxID=1297742 RepID=A0A0H4WNF8_9BACT|nr:hypothetical protein [Myxococcus hansupus]AKQ64981.1 hypothetical protein A176_001893 [Myxococcus hansupus]
MNLVLAPEPAPWLSHLESLLTHEAEVLAPWARPRLPGWAPLPSRLHRAWTRRTLRVPDGYRVWGLPGWGAMEVGLRVVARSTAATFQARFSLRRRWAQSAAALLPVSVETVLAPTLGAREVFAAARRRGARCVLVEDLPSLRALHEDLDAAAVKHPEEAFLRNHRASAEDVARQEVERVLADEIWVRSELAFERLKWAGHAPEKLRRLHFPPDRESTQVAQLRRHPGPHVALLAGPALARCGVREALAVLDARPQWTLWLRPAEGTDPLHLNHPRVRTVTAEVQRTLQRVDVVLAPAWCESHVSELAHAHSRGIPVIATDRAAGFEPCRTIPRGDVPALIAELDALTER